MSEIIVPVYICALVASVLALVLAIILSNNVSYQPNLSDVRKRKVIFWFSSIVAPVVSALLAFLFVYRFENWFKEKYIYATYVYWTLCFMGGICCAWICCF